MREQWKKKRRVTVTMEPDVYALFRRFGAFKSWSDDKTGSKLIAACFSGSVYVVLRGFHERIEKEEGSLFQESVELTLSGGKKASIR